MRVLNPLVRLNSIEKREYQIKIAEEATKRNTLVVLPTALGKTIIAALTASYFLYYYSYLKVLVMAPTRPLAHQHREVFLRVLRLNPSQVAVLTGRNPPSYRLHLWSKPYRLYFATPQVVRNDLENGLSLKDFSLLIFDECHRARRNHAYTKIAKAYVNQCPYPIIMGLTASPGADWGRIKEICDALFIERIEARSEDDPDVKPYVNPVEIDWRIIPLPDSYLSLRDMLREMLRERVEKLRELGFVDKEFSRVYRKDLVELGEELRRRIESSEAEWEKPRLYNALMIQSSALTLHHALELLVSQGPKTLRSFLEKIASDRKMSHLSIVKEPLFKKALSLVRSGSLKEHPKMHALEEVVLEQLALKPDSKIIVFTQYRETAREIKERLLRLGIKAERFIGQADRGGDLGLSQEEQVELIEKLRKGELKALVATSIGEEGLDIPSVDLVVFYEPVPSEIRFIQRKGRTGRVRFGRVVILASKESLDISYLRLSKFKAEKMKKIIGRLNKELKSIIRIGPKPEIKPMELEVAEESGVKALEIDEVDEELREFKREVNHVAKLALSMILGRGVEGVFLSDLISELGVEGFSPAVVREALNKLLKENQVKRIGSKIYPVGVISKVSGLGEIHLIEVEKVLPEKAIVLVDDCRRAVLLPVDYSGPRSLIRRGSRFKASSKLYRLNGKLHVRIYGIIYTFS